MVTYGKRDKRWKKRWHQLKINKDADRDCGEEEVVGGGVYGIRGASR